mgnify:CR=1 FL=1
MKQVKITVVNVNTTTTVAASVPMSLDDDRESLTRFIDNTWSFWKVSGKIMFPTASSYFTMSTDALSRVYITFEII